jgi:hypothetical protein
MSESHSPRGGRPKAVHPKDVRVTVRLTEAEMRRIEQHLPPGTALTAFLRQCITRGLAQMPRQLPVESAPAPHGELAYVPHSNLAHLTPHQAAPPSPAVQAHHQDILARRAVRSAKRAGPADPALEAVVRTALSEEETLAP